MAVDLLILLFFLSFGFMVSDILRKTIFKSDSDQSATDHHIKKNYSEWQQQQIAQAFYSRDDFARLSKDEKILSTYMYATAKVPRFTFWNYVFWKLDDRFRKEYVIRLLITGVLLVIMGSQLVLPWYIDIGIVSFFYLLTDFLSYQTHRFRSVTRWDPEWTKHDSLRTGSILDED